jgi:hypothetical protein
MVRFSNQSPLSDESGMMVWTLIEERERRPCWNNRDGLNPEDYSRLKIKIKRHCRAWRGWGKGELHSFWPGRYRIRIDDLKEISGKTESKEGTSLRLFPAIAKTKISSSQELQGGESEKTRTKIAFMKGRKAAEYSLDGSPYSKPNGT